MTGAPMPEGADAIVAVELTDGGAATGAVTCRPGPRPHVRPRGEDVRPATVVWRRATVLGPRHLALLAAAATSRRSVHRRPRVVVLSTGSELVEPGQPLEPGQIYDSNSSMLCAAPSGRARRRDPPAPSRRPDDALLAALDELAPSADLVITSGGVSMGVYDVVKRSLPRGQGVEFVKVAMQPGKPQGYGCSPVRRQARRSSPCRATRSRPSSRSRSSCVRRCDGSCG